MLGLQRGKLLSSALAVWASLSGAAVAQSLHTANGIAREASLIRIGGEPELRFEFSQPAVDESPARTEVSFADLVRWGSWRGPVDHQAVWLQDESWLCGDLQWDSQLLQVNSSLLKLPPISLNSVRGIVLLPPASLGEFIALRSEMRAVRGDRDVVWLVGGRKLTGILRLSDNQPGAPQQPLTIEHAGRSVELEIDSVRAIVFSPALYGPLETSPSEFGGDGTQSPSAALTANQSIALRDGSLLNFNRLLVRPTQVEFELVAGIHATSLDAPAVFAQELTYLLAKPVGVEFLADRSPANFRNLSDTLLEWPLGRNQDVWRRPLFVDGGMVARGLAMHANSQAAYRWDGRPARFMAEIVLAVPMAADKLHHGSVACKVLLAKDGKLHPAAEYELFRRNDAGGHQLSGFVDVDLTGAQLIALVVESATLGSYSDHVLWLDARIAIRNVP